MRPRPNMLGERRNLARKNAVFARRNAEVLFSLFVFQRAMQKVFF